MNCFYHNYQDNWGNVNSCTYICKDIVQFSCGNGHPACKNCIISYYEEYSNNLICPTCNKQLSKTNEFKIDVFANRVLLREKVKCPFPNKNNNMYLEDPIDNQNKNGLNENEKSKLKCEWIGELSRLENHLMECEYRYINCKYCNELIIKCELDNHFNICNNYPMLCTLKCGMFK